MTYVSVSWVRMGVSQNGGTPEGFSVGLPFRNMHLASPKSINEDLGGTDRAFSNDSFERWRASDAGRLAGAAGGGMRVF